jgi:hypothetical protein
MLSCPVCRATNSQGPACRRCRADLGLLFGLEAQRDRLLANARDHLRQGQPENALAALATASALRGGDDVRLLRAVSHLLLRSFDKAWREYREPGSRGCGGFKPPGPGLSRTGMRYPQR